MEYVRGETLRARLRRGPMEVESAQRTAASLLEALAHAHAYEVIHRDIKPENVMRREDGTVKLLDFGIAKRVDVADLKIDPEAPTVHETRSVLTALTQVGAVVGTIGYMPPEQLRGEAVDLRVDLFAVGALLYEMIAGRPAFPGKTAAQRITATVSGELAPLGVPEAGPDLEAVVKRALALPPDERYGTAAEFLRDLQALASGEAIAILPDTLAILDFATQGSDDDSWIGGAVATSLAADLARVEGLGVLPREKVARARAASQEQDSVRLGLALGCRWVLDGTVQRMGPSIRITHRLLEVATGNVAHTGKSDGKYDDLFSLQDALAASVAEHLHVALPERTTGRSAERDLDVHECVARGKAAALTMDRGRFDEAEHWLLRAIEAEPAHAEALSLLAMVHAPGRWMLGTDPAELERAIDFARRATEADPGHANGQVWLGYALWRQGDLDAALVSFERATSSAPDHVWAHYFTAIVSIESGDFDRALSHAQRAAAPASATSLQLVALGWALQVHGDAEEALWAFERAVELEARGGPMASRGARVFSAECLFGMGRLEEARRSVMLALDEIEESDQGFRDLYRTSALCVLARVAAAQGDLEAARASLDQCITHLSGRPAGLGTGFTHVTALALRARIDGDLAAYAQALGLFLNRNDYDFNMAGLGMFYARDELVAAAEALGRPDDVERVRAGAPATNR
jgi:serine/threonine-protein kinase